MFFAAAAYTGWVAWDVHSSGQDGALAGAQTRSSTPSPSVEVAAPETVATPPSLGPFRKAASVADTILVIGDSTGAGSGAWVDLVARDLGDQHHVTLHAWQETPGQFEVPTTYGGPGGQVDVWNLSYPGIEADYADHLGDVPQPDVVLLDIGHDRSRRAAARAALTTLEAVGERWGDVPTAVVLQNPSAADEELQQRQAVRRLTRFAAEYGDPVIDVYSAFQQAEPGRTLVDGGSRPTQAGQRLWADVVDDALGVTGSE